MKHSSRPPQCALPLRRLLILAAALLLPALTPCRLAAAPRSAGGPKPAKKTVQAAKPGQGDAAKADIAAELDPGAGAVTYREADCIALAARQNPDVLAAAKRVDAARATITTAKAQVFPSLTTTGYYQRREQSIANGGTVTVDANGQVTNSNFNRTTDYYGDVRVTQNLYSGQAVRSRIAAAKLTTQENELDLQAQIDTTTLTVRSAFYQTLYAEASIDVQQQAVDLLTAQVKDQQDKLAVGTVGQLNVNRTQVQLANERPGLLNAQAALGSAYATLAQVLGVRYQTGSLKPPFRVNGTLEARPMTMTLGECMVRAYAKRPEIQSRQLAIDVLKKQIVVEKSATRPQINAYASYDIYSEPDIRTVNDNYSGYTLAVTASWTLFDGFATRGRVRTVQAQIGEAEAQLAATTKQVENDVYSAYTDLRAAEGSLQPLAENIRLASEALDLTSRNFGAGLTSQLDVLQSRVDLTRSRSGELAGRLAYNNALAKLERAMALGRPAQGNATAMPAKPAK